MKIMIVDDNARIRETIRKIVQNQFDEVIEFADASSALAACIFEKPDWVLMDIRMPGMDGIEATRLIHNIFPTSRVTIVTEYADDRHRKAAAEAGADSFVSKENLTELRRIVADIKKEI
ncbi:MAG TPA: response regulator transcription factor [Candidatus Acidoferrales bacterium]|nr:response regulator transcription factor [Candidatus Acidoferrales bacterium]